MSKPKKNWRVKRRHFCHWIRLDSLFQKTRSSPTKNKPFSQEMHLKIQLLSLGSKLPNAKPRCRVSAFHFLWNTYHQWLFDIEVIHISAFSASYSRINPCFTARKRIVVWICHAIRGHQKTTIFTSIVYDVDSPVWRYYDAWTLWEVYCVQDPCGFGLWVTWGGHSLLLSTLVRHIFPWLSSTRFCYPPDNGRLYFR